MNTPSVSIVVATFNRSGLLQQVLDSVAAQSYRDWECLVCDDGSTDDTVESVRKRGAVDPRFRLITGERAGWPAVPRNRGVRAARAKWVAFLDDDDFWHPAKLERQMAIAEGGACEAVSVRSAPYVDGALPEFGPVVLGQSASLRTLADVMLQRPPYPTTPATMVTRDALLAVGGFAEAPAYRAVEDYDLWCRLLCTSGFAWLIDDGEPLVAFRDQGPDSISSWSRVLDPDVIRQRWAALESISRITCSTSALSRSDRATVISELLRRSDDCASRCEAVGWRQPAASALALSSLAALAVKRPLESLRRLYRMGRLVTTRRGGPVPPPAIPVLVRRSLRFTFRILIGSRAFAPAVPIATAGRWSSLVPDGRPIQSH